MSNAVIGALRVSLGLDSAQFTRGVADAQNRMQQFGRRMQVIGAAVSAVGTGVAVAVRGQVNAMDELAKAASRIGVPVEALSQLQHAAELSDIGLSDLQSSMQRLSRAMVDDADAFEAVGIAVRDASGEMRPVMDVFQDLSDRLAEMPEGAERTALAMDLMGRSGANMMPLMAGGAAAIREMMEEADRLGLTVSGETAAAAEQFNDNLTRLRRTFTGVTRVISAELVPMLESLSQMLVSASEVFQSLSPTTRRFAAAIAGITVVVGPLTIAAGVLVVALAGISAPVLAAVAAFTAITAAAIALWPHFVAIKDTLATLISDGLEALDAALMSLQETMSTAGANAAQALRARFEELAQYFAELPARFMEFGRNIVTGLWNGLRESWDNFSITDTVRGWGSSLRDSFANALGMRSPSRVFHQFGEWVVEGLSNGILARSQEPVAAIQGIADQLSGPVQEAARSVESAFESAFVGFVTGTMSARSAIASLLQDLAKLAAQSAFRSLFSNAFGGGGFLSRIFGGFRAEGGPVSAGRSYVVGERGPELFVPQGSGQIIPNGGAAGGDPVQVVIRVLPSGEFDARVENTARAVVRVETPRQIAGAMGLAREERIF
jgi:TP901 family phage tail tape measure protein